MEFIEWATGPGYVELVAEREGWANVPPGTRTSLYENQDYLDAAPFAQMTYDSILSADPTNPTVDPVPLYRHPVRRDPGIRGARHRGQPDLLLRRWRVRCRWRMPGRRRRPLAEDEMEGRRLLSPARPTGAGPSSAGPPPFL